MDRRRFLAACATVALPVVGEAGSPAAIAMRRLRWTMTIENPGAEALLDSKVFLYAPVSTTSIQALKEVTVSAPHRTSVDTLGNTIIEVAYPQFAPFATTVAAFDALVQMRASPSAEKLLDRQVWLAAEPYIEADAPVIRLLAAQLRRDSDEATALAIYEWVRGNLVYAGYIADDMGALYALNARRGDCTEYGYLVTALARAAGIPARPIGGYVVEHDAVLRASEYHNWAELYFDGAWQQIDAQKCSYRPESQSYVAFEIVSARTPNALRGAHRYATEGPLKVRFG